MNHYTKSPSMHARLSAIYDTDLPPSELLMAWANHRQEAFVETGMEGYHGAGASYHLEKDVTRYLVDAVELMQGRAPGMSHGSRARDALRALTKGVGYRYVAGVQGIADGLNDRGTPKETLEKFHAGRAVFLRKLSRLLDASWVVNERSENPHAVTSVMHMIRDELRNLCDWMELSGQHKTARWVRMGLREYEDAVRRGKTMAA